MEPIRSRFLARAGVGALLMLLTACGSVAYPGVGHSLTVHELKLRLIGQVGHPLFCGPPVVRVPAPTEADQEEAALSLQPEGQAYRFDYIAARPDPEHVTGTIAQEGAITLEHHDATSWPRPGGCPICLAAKDLIATPDGSIPVTQLRTGMLVWTLDAAGHRIAAPILRLGHRLAPRGHQVVRLWLKDGRTVEASPGHPTSDGRLVGQLKPGDPLDGSRVLAVELVPYTGDTWDLLPAGPTGTYWANGVPLGSTL